MAWKSLILEFKEGWGWVKAQSPHSSYLHVCLSQRGGINSCQNYFTPDLSRFAKNLAPTKFLQHLCAVSLEALCRLLTSGKRLGIRTALARLYIALSSPLLETTCEEDPPFHALTEDRSYNGSKELRQFQ